jgi:hypothetical protein
VFPVFRLAPQGLIAALLLGWSSCVSGADLRSVTVELGDKRYHLVSMAWFADSREDLYRVLSDYDLFRKFTSAFVDTHNVAPDELGRPRFYTRMEGCVLLFCKSLRRNGYLILKPDEEIIAISLPEQSDFKHSHERWQLQEDGEGTLMTYDFEMEPDFWVPPLIGPFVIKRTLREGGTDAIDRIEAIALGREPKR